MIPTNYHCISLNNAAGAQESNQEQREESVNQLMSTIASNLEAIKKLLGDNGNAVKTLEDTQSLVNDVKKAILLMKENKTGNGRDERSFSKMTLTEIFENKKEIIKKETLNKAAQSAPEEICNLPQEHQEKILQYIQDDKDDTYADRTLLFNDGEKTISIAVHSSLLILKSEYFKTLLSPAWEGNKDDNKQIEIDCSAIQSETFKPSCSAYIQLIRILKNGEVKNLGVSELVDVYILAHFFDMPSVQEQCKEALLSEFNKRAENKYSLDDSLTRDLIELSSAIELIDNQMPGSHLVGDLIGICQKILFPKDSNDLEDSNELERTMNFLLKEENEALRSKLPVLVISEKSNIESVKPLLGNCPKLQKIVTSKLLDPQLLPTNLKSIKICFGYKQRYEVAIPEKYLHDLFSHCKGLEEIYLQNCEVSIDPSCLDLDTLENLKRFKIQISTIPVEFVQKVLSKSAHLEEFYMQESGSAPGAEDYFSFKDVVFPQSLKVLVIDVNSLTDDILIRILSELEILEQLAICQTNCALKGVVFKDGLKKLDLRWCDGITDENLKEALKNITSLEEISLGSTELTVDSVVSQKNIQSIEMEQGCKTDYDDLLKKIPLFPNLKVLYVNIFSFREKLSEEKFSELKLLYPNLKTMSIEKSYFREQ